MRSGGFQLENGQSAGGQGISLPVCIRAKCGAHGSGGKEYTEKAQRFVDEDDGYTESQREELFAQCREFRFKIGTSHVLTLLRVSDQRKRRALQTAMIRDRWSYRQLMAEIAKKCDNPGGYAGRPTRKPTDAKDAEYAARQAFQRAFRVFDFALRVVYNQRESEVPAEALALLFCKHVGKLGSAILEANPPLAAISRRMRKQIEQLHSTATTKSK